jgi:hypothetical protein
VWHARTSCASPLGTPLLTGIDQCAMVLWKRLNFFIF